MLTIEDLKKFGADTDTGLTRCMGNEELYLRLVKAVCSEQNFAKLKDAIAVGDKDNAFEAAHALKGVLGNLSLTPLYDKAAEMTEFLRHREDKDYAVMFEELDAFKKELDKLCG